MAEFGILVDYEWCTGCHSCEMACAVEHEFPVGQCGIKVFEVGPWQYGLDDEFWQLGYQPSFTDQCDLCSERTESGKIPTCVKHCQAKCLEYGTLEELSRKLSCKTRQELVALG